MATRTEPVDYLAGGVPLAIGVLISGATQGSILFVGDAADLTEDNANLFWDDANNRLGLLTDAPSDTLDIGAGGTLRLRDITVGSVIFAAANGVLSQDNIGLFFDPVLNRLGIGTISPGTSIQVVETNTSFAAALQLAHTATSGPGVASLILSVNSGVTGDPNIQFVISGGQSWALGVDNSGGDNFMISTGVVLGTTTRFSIDPSGLVGIGAGPTTILDVTQEAASIVFRMFNSTVVSTANLVAHSHMVRSSNNLRLAVQTIANLDDITDASRTGRWRIRLPDNGTDVDCMVFIGRDIGIGQSVPARRLHLEQDDASNAAITQLLRLTHTTSGAPAIGIGVGMEFEVETAAGNLEIGAIIEALTTDVGAATEDFDLVFRTMAAGAAAAERMRLTSAGALDFLGITSILNIAGAGNDWTQNALVLSNDNAGGRVDLLVKNTDNTNTASNARLFLSSGGGSSGNPIIQFNISAVLDWSIGIDNDQSDRFAISKSSALGTTDALRITDATPPVISYSTAHPTGTFDYVCDACGRHGARPFDCCGPVVLHDDVEDFTALVLEKPGGLEYMEKVGVMERTFDNEGRPEVFTKLGPDWMFVGSMALQNRKRMDRYYAELDHRLRTLGA